jgi:predicted TIM-barrel fold metal-dependent hydrolase
MGARRWSSVADRCARSRPVPSRSLRVWRTWTAAGSTSCASGWVSAPSKIGTFPGNRDFDDPVLFPFFEACAALDVAVFVHPAMPVAAGDRLARYDVREVVHYPLETTVAIAALIFGGVLERLPRLRIGFAHGGGALPVLLGRFDHGGAVRGQLHETAPRPPTEYAAALRRFAHARRCDVAARG